MLFRSTVLDGARRLDSGELQARGLLLAAELALRSPDGAAEAVQALTTALEVAPADKPLLAAQIQAWLARAHAWRGEAAAARGSAQAAEALFAKVAQTLPEQRRAGFVALHAGDRAVASLLAHGPTVARSSPSTSAALPAVLAINRRLSAELDLARLLELVMDSAILLVGAERGFLLLDDGSAPEAKLRVAVARNLDRENLKHVQHKLSHSIALEVMAEIGRAHV